MGWEKRGNKTYYYSKSRVRGSNKIESTYYGSSANETAITMANLDFGRKLSNCVAKDTAKIEKAQYNAFNQEIAQIDILIKSLTNAVFLINGYHFHKGNLRKLRKPAKEKENELTCIVSRK